MSVLISVMPRGPDDAEKRRAKAAALLVAAYVGARVAPGTLGPIAEYGFGIAPPAVAGGAVGATPLAPTNLLPQPFGLVPAQDYQLKPNFYLPGTTLAGGPTFIPGVAEQTAERDRLLNIARDERERAELEKFEINATGLSDDKLRALIAALQKPEVANKYSQPDVVRAIAANALARREAEYQRQRAARAAYEAAEQGGSMPTDPQAVLGQGATPQGAFTALVQRAADAAYVPPVPTTAPNQLLSSAQQNQNSQGQRLPNGFTNIPAPGGGGGGDFGAIKNENQGPFIDRFIAEQNADPWPMS